MPFQTKSLLTRVAPLLNSGLIPEATDTANPVCLPSLENWQARLTADLIQWQNMEGWRLGLYSE